MPKSRFYLKASGSDGKYIIIMSFYWHGQRLKYSTGHKIDPALWSHKDQAITRDKHKYRDLNNLLTNLRRTAENTYTKCINDQQRPTREVFKKALDKFMFRIKEDSLKGFIDSFILARSKDPRFTPGTITVYKTNWRHAKEFSKAKRRPLEYSAITQAWFSEFELYMINKGYANNTVNKALSTFKTFLRATPKEIRKEYDYESLKITVSKEDVYNPFLTSAQLKQLYEFEYEHNYQRRAVDLFLIGAYTGLRVSDWKKVSLKNIRLKEGIELIDIYPKKGRAHRVTIPLNQIAKEILLKYNDQLPTTSDQKINDYIKEAAQAVGFTENITKGRTEGGKTVVRNYKLYELITTHTARRSFATNAYYLGVPQITIMSITGHKKESTFLKYVKLNKDDHAVKFAKTINPK